MPAETGVAIIGAGIVGLAIGLEISDRFPGISVTLIEKEPSVASHQTSHNSGVIHSGIYYKPGSLKAKLCVEGRKMLWEYCDAKQIPYKNVGKLIVATEERELPNLDELYQRGIANGIDGLEVVDADGIKEREPHVRGIKAIFSPVTGIIDYGVVARSYADDVRAMGGTIETNCEVTGIDSAGGKSIVHSTKGDAEATHI